MPVKYTILAMDKSSPEQRKQLEESAPGCVFIYDSFESINQTLIETADIILGNPPQELLTEAKRLKWLQLCSAGADRYYKNGVLPEGCILTNATGTFGLAISEHMLGTILMLMKKLHIYNDNQRESLWRPEDEIKPIYGSTFLIIGMGDIGNEFAKRIKSLGGYTIGIKRNLSARPEYVDELYTVDKLDSILPFADVVTLSLPGNHETYRIMNNERLHLLKKDAIIVNVGRGTAIDLPALCDMLNNGLLWGAALDVTDPEPLSKDHLAWKTRNLLITPHISGGFQLSETYQRFVNIAAYNLKAFLSNAQLKNIVDMETGYRKFLDK